jgi:Protein of unknown function (DUF2971)
MPYPEVIYKYRDWDNPLHRSILLYNELYLASPKDFNDPFDCRISKSFNLLDTEEKKRKYVDKLMIQSFGQWDSFSKTPIEMMKDMENRLQDLPRIQKEFEILSFREHDNHYGVICFSAVWNDILMWSHYGKNHQGVCIGFYEDKIKRSANVQGKGGMVIYDSDYPIIHPLDDDHMREMFLTTHYKSSKWSYECEYRISKLYYPQIPSNRDRIFNFSDDFIAEVILGLNINEVNKREIISICSNRNIPVYQTIKVPQKFYITCTLCYP